MTYETTESSVYEGDVVEIYEFTLGSMTWRQTSNALDYTHSGNIYTSYTLQRTRVERTGELNRSKITITASTDNPIAQLFIQQQPRSKVGVRVFRGHRGSTDFRVEFTGRVLDCKWTGKRQVSLSCEPEITSWRRQSLKYNNGTNCPYVLYSGLCRAAKTSIGGTVRFIDGLDIYIQPDIAITAGRLVGGTVSQAPQSRSITSHTNGTYSGYSVVMTKMEAQFPDIIATDRVSLLIGCDHSTTACKDWHNNLNNFGGDPYIPKKNIFKGRLLV